MRGGPFVLSLLLCATAHAELPELSAFLKAPESSASAARSAAGETVWVTMARVDMERLARDGLSLGSPIFSGNGVVGYSVSADFLPRLSAAMHERFGRCGGYFAHVTREGAEADLAPPGARAAADYTLDQEAVVRPIMKEVREGELRSMISALAAFHNRYYQAETGAAAARWIQSRWQALAAAWPGAQAKLVSHANWKQPSVVLTIPGSEPDAAVVLGGHLDSIAGFWGGESARAPGADDNASGIAVLTEAIRVLAVSGWRPRKTVHFMGYAAEEVGLRGSREIADSYAREGRKVLGVIQFDMTNFKGSPEDIFLLEDNVDPALTAFTARLVDAYTGGKRGMTKCGYGCSDHASWTRAGLPAAAAFESAMETMNDKLHTERDTLASSGGDAAHSVYFARLAAAFAVELAKTAPAARPAASR